ncbi:myosin type-2 heavy chain 1-like [Zingiber officinale]|uniref:myosin type-2 heavy chain 1-like n=1 Tax=Zingiber officinale TaxID=94328 RepID=UPI001C4CCDFC|nr:myosin type-2 heavy chain 1-like [Zingiber officinale]
MAARHGRGEPETMMVHLPRRSRGQKPGCRRNLRDLLDQERSYLASMAMAMAAAGTPASDVGVVISGCKESCQTQAEILLAERDFLRMDLESSTGKQEPERARKDAAMRSNENSLVPGRKKIDARAGDRGDLEGGIDDLEEKMQELKLRRSRSKGISMKLSRRRYFHRQSSVLRRDMVLIKEDAAILKGIKEASLLNLAVLGKRPDVEEEKMVMLKRKMEGLSRGMLERIEECSHLLSSKSTSSQDIVSYNEAEHMPFLHLGQQLRQEKSIEKQKEFRCCSCMEAVGRIRQQVWAESEQWSEMQQLLEQVKIEMEEIRSSRDHWQRQAVASEINFHILHTQKLKWKRKAQSSECKVIDLQNLVLQHEKELQSLWKKIPGTPSSSSPQHTELCIKRRWRKLLDSSEEEKHAPPCHLKSETSNRRLPLLNINNISQPLRPIIGAWSPT